MTFGTALMAALVLRGVWLIGDGIVGNNLKTAAIGSAFIIVGWLAAGVSYLR